MSIYKLIHLKFGRNLVHFGETGIGIEETSERVKSDTLFSALISSYARLFEKEKVENLLAQLNQNNPPFCHSSTFIYKKYQNKYTYYLPKPLIFPTGYNIDDDLDFTKTYRKIAYLPLTVWKKWYQQEGFTDQDKQELIAKTKGKETKDGWLTKQGLFDYENNFKSHKTPKVSIDRINSTSNFYHTGFVQFNYQGEDNHTGLYFLLKFNEENLELERQLSSSLYLLGEEGIGGERSSGAGRFKMEWLELPSSWQEIIQFNQPDYQSLISLFWQLPLPSKFIDRAYYEIKERGGWIASPFSGRQLRRKMVRMFSEGSVFPTLSQDFDFPQGKLADVTPTNFKTHKIYRSGINFSLPISVINKQKTINNHGDKSTDKSTEKS